LTKSKKRKEIANSNPCKIPRKNILTSASLSKSYMSYHVPHYSASKRDPRKVLLPFRLISAKRIFQSCLPWSRWCVH